MVRAGRWHQAVQRSCILGQLISPSHSSICCCSALRCEGVRSGRAGRGAEPAGDGEHSQAHGSYPCQQAVEPLAHHLHGDHGTAARGWPPPPAPPPTLRPCLGPGPGFQVSLCGPGGLRANCEDGKHGGEAEGEYPDQQWSPGLGQRHQRLGRPSEEEQPHSLQGLQNYQVQLGPGPPCLMGSWPSGRDVMLFPAFPMPSLPGLVAESPG